MRCWLVAVHQSGFISMNLFMPICLLPLFLPSPNPPFPPSSCHSLSSSILPFLHCLLHHSFLAVFSPFSLASSSLHCTPLSSIHTCSKSLHPSVTQLLVSSFWGALACFSKVIFPEFQRFHFKKLRIRSSSGKKNVTLRNIDNCSLF